MQLTKIKSFHRWIFQFTQWSMYVISVAFSQCFLKNIDKRAERERERENEEAF